MTRHLSACLALVFIASCSRMETPQYGGEPERALVEATVARDLAGVERLLASGANPNAMVVHDGDRHSAWELALKQSRPGRPAEQDIIRALLSAGANPDWAWGTGSPGGTRIPGVGPDPPLQLAMLRPDPQVVRAILAKKPRARGGPMALVMAIEEGQTEIAHLLVDAGVDVNTHPSANTPLLAAIEARDEAMMKYLEDHGAREKP